MNNIKVCILGSDGYVCQIPRIKEAMKSLGHVLSQDSPDLIYSNDPRGYNEALLLKKKIPTRMLNSQSFGYTLAHANYRKGN